MNRTQRIAVTGATGRVGSQVVEILEQRRHDVVPIARSKGVDVVSIIGIDKFQGGYNAAKVAQEQTLLEGPLPVRIVRGPVPRVRRSAGRVDDPGW
jgi:1-deoxy-D-xylulose 5-phosphate reductoisomerase